MTTYYVATLVLYVLVQAADDAAARIVGEAALRELNAELGERIGRDIPIGIRTVRPATVEEIEFNRWNEETLSQEGKQARISQA